MNERVATGRLTYLRFVARLVSLAMEGTRVFYAGLVVLTAIALVGAHAWAEQTARGMGVTGMSDHVSWGLYIANFTFLVGLAAGGVMMVIPAYLYQDEDMHDVVIVGEIVAVAAIVMALLFVVADLGRPDRFWHMLPFVGRFHSPVSMLTWDVLVLSSPARRPAEGSAPTYAEARERRHPNRLRHARNLADMTARSPRPVGVSPVTRAQRRAFEGAPPTVPHPVDQAGFPACLTCHREGMDVAGRMAPATSHPERGNCLQCHVVSLSQVP